MQTKPLFKVVEKKLVFDISKQHQSHGHEKKLELSWVAFSLLFSYLFWIHERWGSRAAENI